MFIFLQASEFMNSFHGAADNWMESECESQTTQMEGNTMLFKGRSHLVLAGGTGQGVGVATPLQGLVCFSLELGRA